MNKTSPLDEAFAAVRHKLLYRTTLEIARIMREKNLTKSQLAEKMNVSPSWVNKALNGQQNLTLKTILLIAIAMDVEVKVLLESPKDA